MSAGELMGHDDADPDDDGLSSFRAAWRSMPDEEPPARGLAELMAAARAKADEMAPPPEPWWQRVLATLRRPQVLALATIVLVAGGAVLVGRHREGMEAPAVQSPATQPERSRDEVKGTAHEMAPVEATGTDAKAVATPPPVTQTPRPQKESKSAGVGGATLAPKQPETRGAEKVEQSVESEMASDAIEQTPTSAQLHTRARAAATAKDCATARALLAQLQRSDAAYYESHVANDATLAACK